MMVEIVVYGYVGNMYWRGGIEELCGNEMGLMWVRGNVSGEDNRMKGLGRRGVKDVVKRIFGRMVKLVVWEGFVSVDVGCREGRKMEGEGKGYRLVWGKWIDRGIWRMGEEVEEIWG